MLEYVKYEIVKQLFTLVWNLQTKVYIVFCYCLGVLSI